MAVSFGEIEKNFNETFGFIEADLKRILDLEVGGNYAVALLVACACDTLAEYRYGKGQGTEVFKELLPLPEDSPYRKAAEPIYRALRNGLVHRYDGYNIRFNEQTLCIAIAWKEGKHLSVRIIDGVPNLILNVRQLCDALFQEFENYRCFLKEKQNAQARESFLYRSKKNIKEVRDSEQICALKSIVGKADAWYQAAVFA